jgi:hypothetical protein
MKAPEEIKKINGIQGRKIAIVLNQKEESNSKLPF